MNDIEKTPTQKSIEILTNERLRQIKIKLENSDHHINRYQFLIKQDPENKS
jgi:hypothetical protein